MRQVPTAIQSAWVSGNFTGTRRPFARVTVQRGRLHLFDRGINRYASYLLDNTNVPKEMPNVREVSWERDIDADTATATIEFWNANPLPLGVNPGADWQRLGYFSFNRGSAPLASQWGHNKNDWRRMIMPDNILRTYEGYGFDANVIPEEDPHLIQTGVWIIDDVVLTSSGLIRVECRDAGRLLLDHHAYRPVIPPKFYPLSFQAVRRTSGYYPAGTVVYQADWAGPIDPATNVVMTAEKIGGATFTWDDPPPIEPDEALPPDLAGGQAYHSTDDDNFWVRMPDAKWYVCGGIGSRKGVEYLYGPYTQILRADVGTYGGSVTDLFGGPGQLERYTPRYELVGFRAYINGELQSYAMDETVHSLEVTRLSNGAWYSFEIAPVYQELNTGRRETGQRSAPIFFSPGDSTMPRVTPGTLEADFNAAGNPADGYLSWNFSGGTKAPFTWVAILYRGDDKRVFTVAEASASGTAEVDTGEAELDEWNILVYPRKSGETNGRGWGLFRTSGGAPEFYATSGAAGVPPEPPPATGHASATGPTGYTSPLEPVRAGTNYHSSSGGTSDHPPVDATDAFIPTYWTSKGHVRPDSDDAFEWVQVWLPAEPHIIKAGVRTAQRNLRCYVSIMINGRWVQHDPGDVVPYRSDDLENHNGANIPYVAVANIPGGDANKIFDINLRQTYTAVERMRFTFTNLQHVGSGSTPYRAQVNEVLGFTDGVVNYEPVHTPANHDTDDGGDTVFLGARVVGGAGQRPGTYEDYTDIVKLACAWSGLFWPEDGRVYKSDGTYDTYSFGSAPYNLESFVDPVLGGTDSGGGRIWGNIEYAGVAGIADLPVSMFDKRPLMDAVIQVRDILGYAFHVNELGQAVFRRLNVFSIGNNVIGPLAVSRSRTVPTLDARRHLVDELSVSVSSRNVRERLFVASSDGKHSGVAKGINPNPTGLRRVGGWTDQGFVSDAEAQLMADMIALRQLFRYRTDTAIIPGYPRIQIDDQVQIVEEVTGEAYIHYVKSIASTNNLEEGTWDYTLGTHWLGSDPTLEWAFSPELLSQTSRNYLSATDPSYNPQIRTMHV